MIDTTVLVMPMFVGLMGAELVAGRARGERLYTLVGTLDDVASAVTHLVGLAVLGATTFTIYEALRASVAVWELPTDAVWAWVFGWVLSDFCWYWRHRFGHSRLGWAIHEVHHQSPDMNLAVGLRVSVFQWVQTAPFMLPMAVLGMPVAMFTAIFGAAHLYQALLHTQLVDRFRPLDGLLTMPADHRLHHARNVCYRDHNFGHNLIVWDRLFGTYAVEDPADPVVYGIDRPLARWGPVRNNLEPVLELFGLHLPVGAPTRDAATPARRAVAVVGFVLALGGAALLIQNSTTWSLALRMGAGAAIVATFAAAGRLLQAEAAP